MWMSGDYETANCRAEGKKGVYYSYVVHHASTTLTAPIEVN